MIAFLTLLLCAQAVDTSVADRLYADGNYRQAASAYRDLLRQAPNDPMLLTKAGASEYQLGNFEGAASSFRKAMAAVPELPPALTGLGTSLIALGRADEALPVLKRALKATPGDAMVRRALGHAYQRRKQFVEGEVLLRGLVAENPGDAESWYYLGVLYFDRNYAQSALEALTRTLDLQPGNVRAKIYRAGALAQLGDAEKAAQAFAALEATERIELDPEYLAGYGMFLFQIGRGKDALLKFDQALAVASDSAKLHFWRARLLLETGDIEGAAKAAERSAGLDPLLPNPRHLLLRIYRKQGREKDAVRMAAWLRSHDGQTVRGGAR